MALSTGRASRPLASAAERARNHHGAWRGSLRPRSDAAADAPDAHDAVGVAGVQRRAVRGPGQRHAVRHLRATVELVSAPAHGAVCGALSMLCWHASRRCVAESTPRAAEQAAHTCLARPQHATALVPPRVTRLLARGAATQHGGPLVRPSVRHLQARKAMQGELHPGRGPARACAFLPNSLSNVGLSSSTMLLLSRSQICAALPRQDHHCHSPALASVSSCARDAAANATCQRRPFELVRRNRSPIKLVHDTQCVVRALMHGLGRGARLDALAGGRAQPVAVGREAERVDDLARVQRVQALALRQVPQHGHRVLRARALSLIRRANPKHNQQRDRLRVLAKQNLINYVVRAGPPPRPCPATSMRGGGAHVRTQAHGYAMPGMQAAPCQGNPHPPHRTVLPQDRLATALLFCQRTALFVRTARFTRAGAGGRGRRALPPDAQSEPSGDTVTVLM